MPDPTPTKDIDEPTDLDADLAMVRAGLFLADLRVPDAFDALDRLEERARRAERAEHAADRWCSSIREALQHSDNELHAIIADRNEHKTRLDAAHDVLRRIHDYGTGGGRQKDEDHIRGLARTFLDSITKGEPDA